MKAFRVRDVGLVEPYLTWTMMDGTAYVPVGGTSLSYLTVSPKLAGHERSGQVFECDYCLDEKRRMVLIPSRQNVDGRALVVVPAGGFNFRVQRGERFPLVPRQDHVARVLILPLGESIESFPVLRNLRDCGSARALALKFDGEKVTFEPTCPYAV